jgi:GDP/UDP-N,N'-diacetylbacillosamine 2-epimerase (hydrolysing)
MQFVDGVVGNSSSGLIEAPSFKVGVINIGDRQRGRLKADNVIDCAPGQKEIRASLQKLFSLDFKNELEKTTNPYGSGGTAGKILEVIRGYPLEDILKKSFYNLGVGQ